MISEGELSRLRALQRVVQHAVTAGDVGAIEAEQGRAYAGLGVPPRDGEALAATDTRRIVVYRKLVRSTLIDAIAAEIPRTAARLGDRYRPLVGDWIAAELPRSQILRDVAFEFAVWAEPRVRAEAAYLADLMRYELFEFDAQVAVDPPVSVSDELAADQVVAFSGSTRLARFGFAVHRLADDVDDRTLPEARPTGVLGYRDESGRFRQLDLTPMATAVLAEMLLEAQPLAAAVQRACAAEGQPVTPKLVEGIAKLLEDLNQRGVVRGGRLDAGPAAPSPYFRWLYAATDAPLGSAVGVAPRAPSSPSPP